MNDSNNYKNIANVSGECFDYVKVYSDGIWNLKHGESILQHSFFRFQVQLVSMVSISYFFHLGLKHFHFPRLTSDVLAGFILGPTILGTYFPEASNLLFPPFPNQVFGSLLKIGLVLFTFLAAVRLDTSWIKRMGKSGLILGCLLFAFPFTLTQTVKLKFDPNVTLTPPQSSARIRNTELYLGSIVRSQFVDVSVLLMQLKITNSRLGRVALAITLLGDIAIFAYTNYNSLMERVWTSESSKSGVQALFLVIFFLLLIFVAMRGLMSWFIRITPEGKPMKNLYTNIFFACVLLVASLGDNMGVDYLFGPFFLGLIVPAGSPLATNLTKKLDTMVYGLLVPLLSTYCASKLNLWALIANLDTLYNFQMGLVGYIIKLIATFLLAFAFNLPWREAAALSLMLNCKGTKEMGVIFSYTPLEAKDLDSASAVLLVFLLTSFVPPLIQWLYDPSKHYIGYRNKCIQYSPYDSELEILVCAHKQEHAMAAIKILELSNPTKQSPISVYGLCLEELVSSANPLLIDHQLGQKSSGSNASRSQPIIDVFQFFKVEHRKSAQLHVFTAVSPLKQMHEDICWLAFDKSCSLILIPFHKRLTGNGKIVSSSNDLRTVNMNVFERAPCSVGLIVDRRKARGLPSMFISSDEYHISMLFLGGSDDREALAYALRMVRSPHVRLTVVNFVAACEIAQHSWEDMLDSEALRNVKQELPVNSNIQYLEERVKDGSDTASMVASIQGKFDLIMVGRRHDTKKELLTGLSQWTEYPELGPLGDILASSDITSEVSALVIQQQILKAAHSSILN